MLQSQHCWLQTCLDPGVQSKFPGNLLHSQAGFLWPQQTYIFIANPRSSKRGLSPNSLSQGRGFSLTVLVYSLDPSLGWGREGT